MPVYWESNALTKVRVINYLTQKLGQVFCTLLIHYGNGWNLQVLSKNYEDFFHSKQVKYGSRWQ